jgi:Arc/MetJ family transcription regulator
MSRTNIELDDGLVRKARRLTGLKTKKSVVNHALATLVRIEARKGMLAYYASGIWRGDLKRMRRNRG